MAWDHTTVGVSPNRVYLKSQTSAAVAMAAAPVYSDVFDYDLSNNGYVWAGINVSIAGNAVAATLKLQVSYDGTNYTSVLTLASDVDPEVTGNKMYYVDLTQYRAPYMRFVFNDASAAVGTAGRFTFITVAKPEKSAF